jgi:Tol biopolymer transport system component
MGSGGVVPAPPALVPPRRRRSYIVAGAVILTAVSAGMIWWRTRTTISPPQRVLMRLTSDSGLTTDPALSPDGKFVAYASDRAGGDNLDIWIKQVDGGVSLRLTSDPENEREPSFSPDGNQIVFHSQRDGGSIYTVPVLGGEPRLIAKGGHNPRFSPDGTRIAFVNLAGFGEPSLFVVPSTGGRPEPLVPGEIGASYPVWSPDGKFILFAAGFYLIDDWAVVPSEQSTRVAVSTVSLTAAEKAGLADLMPREWLAGNRIVFSAKSGDSSHVFEIGLSPPALTEKQWRLELPPKPLTFGTAQDEKPSVAARGSATGARRLAFASLAKSENLWSIALDANQPRTGGKLQRLTEESGFHIFPSISADGTKLVYISHAAYNDELWLLDIKTGKRSLLSTTVSRKFTSYMRPDGSEVIYGEGAHGGAINAVPVSGGASEKLCNPCDPYLDDWSPDRKRILHWQHGKTSTAAIGMLNLETGKESMFLERPDKDVYDTRWSPDGRWIVFSTARKGRSTVYIAPYTADQSPNESAWIPVTDGSTFENITTWSRDGNWIYSISDRDGFLCLWAYRLDPQTKQPLGRPVEVFHSHSARLGFHNADQNSIGFSIAHDKIVFNMGEITGNIWMTELQNQK